MNDTIKMLEQVGNLLFFETRGFSMWPFLKGKDKLIVKRTSISELEVGDLVLYKPGNQLVCHRLVKKAKTNDKYTIYTRGDTSWGPAELIKEEKFLGKVIGVVKKNKVTYIDGLRQRFINRIILLILPLLILINKIYRFLFVKK